MSWLPPQAASGEHQHRNAKQIRGKVRTKQTTSPCQMHIWHNSSTTMESISLPFKLECVK